MRCNPLFKKTKRLANSTTFKKKKKIRKAGSRGQTGSLRQKKPQKGLKKGSLKSQEGNGRSIYPDDEKEATRRERTDLRHRQGSLELAVRFGKKPSSISTHKKRMKRFDLYGGKTDRKKILTREEEETGPGWRGLWLGMARKKAGRQGGEEESRKKPSRMRKKKKRKSRPAGA